MAPERHTRPPVIVEGGDCAGGRETSCVVLDLKLAEIGHQRFCRAMRPPGLTVPPWRYWSLAIRALRVPHACGRACVRSCPTHAACDASVPPRFGGPVPGGVRGTQVHEDREAGALVPLGDPKLLVGELVAAVRVHNPTLLYRCSRAHMRHSGDGPGGVNAVPLNTMET